MACTDCSNWASKPCARFEGNHQFCHVCGFKKLLHKAPVTLSIVARFANVSCSQCGRSFGPGNSGYSHCSQHGGRR